MRAGFCGKLPHLKILTTHFKLVLKCGVSQARHLLGRPVQGDGEGEEAGGSADGGVRVHVGGLPLSILRAAWWQV